MNNASLNQIVNKLIAFGNGHKYIKSVTHGQLDEMDLTSRVTYPLMHIVPQDITPSNNRLQFSFDIVFADLPRIKTDKPENVLEIQSDMEQIARDLYTEIYNGGVLFGDGTEVGEDWSVLPFQDEYHNYLSGVTLSINIIVGSNWNACEIPADWVTGEGEDIPQFGRDLTIAIYDEGNFIVNAREVNFTGGGVNVTSDGNRAIVNITGGGGGGGLSCDDLPNCQTIIDIEANIDAIEEGVTALQSDVSSLQSEQITQNNRLDVLEGDVSTLQGDVSAIQSEQVTQNNRLDAVEGDVTGLQNDKVPYTGATQSVDLGDNGIDTDFIQMDTSPVTALQEGRMRWNDADGTLDMRLKGNNVTLQVGQENVVRVVNKTGGSLAESAYQVVRFRNVSEGGAQGQRMAVVLAQANNDFNSATTIGVVTETIADNQEGFITTFGHVRGINTTGSLQGETWVDGDILYLSPTVAGRLTNIKPVAPNHMVIVGYVEYAHATQGKIFVKVDNGYEIGELHDVNISSPANGQVLSYNSSTSRWENSTKLSYENIAISSFAGTLTFPSGSTRYYPVNGLVNVSNLASDRTPALRFNKGGTMSGAAVDTQNGQTGTGSMVWTLFKGSSLSTLAATSIVITIPAGAAAGTYTSSNSVTINDNDYLVWQVVNNGTNVSAIFNQASMLLTRVI